MRLLCAALLLGASLSALAQESDPTLQPSAGVSPSAASAPPATIVPSEPFAPPASVLPPEESVAAPVQPPPSDSSSMPWTAPARSNLTPPSVIGTPAAAAPAAGFVKPVGPKAGGVLVVPHPNAPKGLLRINKDDSYQYKTHRISKSQSVSVKLGPGTPPKITGPEGSNLTYESMYGHGSYTALNLDYEWQAFRKFGSLGLQVGSGFAIMQGTGQLQSGGKAMEKFTMLALPASAFVIYRLEFSRKQWFVPYLLGGGTLFGLVERRDDGKRTNFALAPTAGGAIGAHFALTGVDERSAFVLSEDYGIADLWFTLEGRFLKGLRSDVDFTTAQITGGVTMDF